MIDRLQASLVFLHEPLANLGRDAVICGLNPGVEELAKLMTARQVTATLVGAGGNGAIIGIVTDHDLRARVLAENVDLNTPIHTIMTSPLTKIPENTLMYEALMRVTKRRAPSGGGRSERPDRQCDRQQIARPVTTLRPDGAGPRDRPRRHARRGGAVLRAHLAAGQEPARQQRPPAPASPTCWRWSPTRPPSG